MHSKSTPTAAATWAWLTLDKGKPLSSLQITAQFFFLPLLLLPSVSGSERREEKICFLWLGECLGAFIRRWDSSRLSFHLSQCAAKNQAEAWMVGEEIGVVRNHLKSEISWLWWREMNDGGKEEEGGRGRLKVVVSTRRVEGSHQEMSGGRN